MAIIGIICKVRGALRKAGLAGSKGRNWEVAGKEGGSDSGEEMGEGRKELIGEDGRDSSGEERGERENNPEQSYSAAWARSTLFLRRS